MDVRLTVVLAHADLATDADYVGIQFGVSHVGPVFKAYSVVAYVGGG